MTATDCESGVASNSDAVREFNTDDCLTPEDNRPIKDSELEDLLASIRTDGTHRIPGIVSLHPTLPGKYQVIAGNRRKRCCEILGIAFRAILIERVLSQAEIIRIRVQENVCRKNPEPFQVCQEICDYKAERKLETWLEVGAELGLTSVALSRFTSVRHIPSSLRPLAERVCPSVCWAIAPLKDAAAMQQAFEYAATPDAGGRLPSRDAVLRYIEPLKAKKPANGSKPKALKGTLDGRMVQLGIMPEESTESVIKWLKAVADKLTKYKEIPPSDLGFLFVG